MANSKDVSDMAQAYTVAWNSGDAARVASFFASDGQNVINRGEPWLGRARVEEMVAGFFADVPDMSLVCDDIRCAGNHAVFVWSFTGHDASSGNALNISGWEDWDLNEDMKIQAARGWFDADDYARQVAG